MILFLIRDVVLFEQTQRNTPDIPQLKETQRNTRKKSKRKK